MDVKDVLRERIGQTGVIVYAVDRHPSEDHSVEGERVHINIYGLGYGVEVTRNYAELQLRPEVMDRIAEAWLAWRNGATE